MNTRLQQFLGAENISQSQLADELGVARASVSHILAGRNKPGYDFLVSLMARYPRLNIEWLMAGKGKMYKDSASATSEDMPQENLFSTPREDEISLPDPAPAADTLPTERETPPAKETQPSENKRTVSKIIVFFDDNTFQEIM